jgi:DNA-3-methyladenine glycosylase II
VTAVLIPVEPSFRFDFALQYLQRSPDEIIDLIRDNRHYRLLPTANGLSLIEISSDRGDSGASIRAKLLAGDASDDEVRSAVERLYPRAHASSNDEPTEPLAVLLDDQYHGLPVVQTLTPWEALVWAVIGQQINIAFAYQLKRRFVESFGERLAYDGDIYFAFPTPERVSVLDHERDLRPIQFSRQKSRYIIEAAQAVISGTLDFGHIENLDDDAAARALQHQVGIGRWTAEYILLRGFGRLDVIPAGDAALKALVGNHLQLGRSATEDEVRDIANRWKPRRGEVGFRLWFAKQVGFFEQ